MVKNILSLAAIILFIGTPFAQEPTQVNITHEGKINWVHYDFRNETTLHPLTNLYMDGNGKVEKLMFDVNGLRFTTNEFGVVQNSIVGNYDIEWTDDNKIETIKQGWTIIARFDYDMDGRLVKIKDASFNVKFKLDYNLDDQLNYIDKGNYDYYARFDYDFDDQLETIKDDRYNVIWRIQYNLDDQFELIKDRDYDRIVGTRYFDGRLQNLINSQYETSFLLGYRAIPNSSHYGGGYGGNVGSECPNDDHSNTGAYVQFFEHSNYGGAKMLLSTGAFQKFSWEWNDKISSIVVPQGYAVVLYEDENFGGACQTLRGNWNADHWDDWWNDRVSSVRITREF